MATQPFRLESLLFLLASSLALAGNIPSLASVVAQDDSRYFPETGHTVKGKFLKYWLEHGGLEQQGFPISEEQPMKNFSDDRTYSMQYFERAAFEYHPENQPPNDVLLSLLGVLVYRQKYAGGAPDQQPSNVLDSVLFSETGRHLGGRFLAYWQSHGGLVQLGFPISDEFDEVSNLDSKRYRVQYFERAVLELHPENSGTPYEVMLSQLGTYLYKQNVSQSSSLIASAQPKEEEGFLQRAWNYITEELSGWFWAAIVCLILLPFFSLGGALRTGWSGYRGEAVRRARMWSMVGGVALCGAVSVVFLLSGFNCMLLFMLGAVVLIVFGWFGVHLEPEEPFS